MKHSMWALCGLGVLITSVAFARQQPATPAHPMLTELKVGQAVSLQRAESSGYRFHLLNEKQVEAAQQQQARYPKIMEVGRDYVVVHQDLVGEQIEETRISVQAIHEVRRTIEPRR